MTRNANGETWVHFPVNNSATDLSWAIHHGSDLSDPGPWPQAGVGDSIRQFLGTVNRCSIQPTGSFARAFADTQFLQLRFTIE